MFKNYTELRVRYGETDQMGIVYHANYAMYFEVGRTEWLRTYGITYKKMEDTGIMLPVVSLHIDYKLSACYDDLLTVVTYLKQTPSVSIEFNYDLFNEKDNLLAKGYTKLAFIDAKTKKLTRCPNYLLDKLKV